MIRFKLFGKIYIYTLMFLCVVIAVFTFFYAKQLETAFTLYERRQLTDDIQKLLVSIEGKSRAEKIEAISDFGIQNETFAFSIRSNSGELLFETPDFYMTETTLRDLIEHDNVALKNLREFDFVFSLAVDNNATLYIAKYARSNIHNDGITQILPLSLILLGISIAGAFLFARMMSKPIKRLANETVKMSNMESVEVPPPRSDEIGILEINVYSMYKQLKTTIAELEDEVRISKELEEKQRYFFSAASHELKTPIAAITAIIEAFIGKVIEAEDYPEYFHKCLHLMKMQGKLISEILDIARLNEGKIAPKNEPINLSFLIQSVLPSYQALSESKKQNITVSMPDDLIWNGEKALMSRVLSNVIMNAIQNTPEGKEIRIWSEPFVSETGENRIKLYILNTNAHIDDTVISRIYEPFYRIDKSRNSSQGNSGLGLTIVKKALDIMKIPFAIENNNEGVLFWMDLQSA